MKAIRKNNTVDLFGTKISLNKSKGSSFPTEMLLSRAGIQHVIEKVSVKSMQHANELLNTNAIEICKTARFIPGELGSTLNKTRKYPHNNKVPNTKIWVNENGGNTDSDNPNFQFCIHPTETREQVIAVAEMFDEDTRALFLESSLRRIDNPPLVLGNALIPLTQDNKQFLEHLNKSENILFITD